MNFKTPSTGRCEAELKIQNLYKEITDAAERFSQLAKVAQSEALTNYYQKKSEARRRFVKELEDSSKGNKLSKISKSTNAGAFSRLHTSIKALFTSDNDEVSLNKATYHEESLLYEYNFVLKNTEDLSENLQNILKKQKQEIEDDLSKIRSIDHLKNN